MIRLELHIDWSITLGISNEWKWKGKGHERPYETSDHQNKICFQYGFFYYERGADVIDYISQAVKTDSLKSYLEWHDVDSIEEMLEKNKEWITEKRYNKYKKKWLS